ncbi:HlyU family transcriptional regulator [Nitratireductor luteus]|uniref:HlyU family transcriptional regulator n=1 Tax=Nitratireductor luteus TaxID=2976980 RepID=UPI0022409CFE|nr:HlyU family transcriptional regulator [Nitratireductor luteus]
MSFLKRLFGGGDASETSETVGEPVEHKGFTIRATPFRTGSEFQTCGVVSKEIDGEVKEHRFIRADRFPSAELAAEQALRKGKQMVDEQGASIF